MASSDEEDDTFDIPESDDESETRNAGDSGYFKTIVYGIFGVALVIATIGILNFYAIGSFEQGSLRMEGILTSEAKTEIASELLLLTEKDITPGGEKDVNDNLSETETKINEDFSLSSEDIMISEDKTVINEDHSLNDKSNLTSEAKTVINKDHSLSDKGNLTSEAKTVMNENLSLNDKFILVSEANKAVVNVNLSLNDENILASEAKTDITKTLLLLTDKDITSGDEKDVNDDLSETETRLNEDFLFNSEDIMISEDKTVINEDHSLNDKSNLTSEAKTVINKDHSLSDKGNLTSEAKTVINKDHSLSDKGNLTSEAKTVMNENLSLNDKFILVSEANKAVVNVNLSLNDENILASEANKTVMNELLNNEDSLTSEEEMIANGNLIVSNEFIQISEAKTQRNDNLLLNNEDIMALIVKTGMCKDIFLNNKNVVTSKAETEISDQFSNIYTCSNNIPTSVKPSINCLIIIAVMAICILHFCLIKVYIKSFEDKNTFGGRANIQQSDTLKTEYYKKEESSKAKDENDFKKLMVDFQKSHKEMGDLHDHMLKQLESVKNEKDEEKQNLQNQIDNLTAENNDNNAKLDALESQLENVTSAIKSLREECESKHTTLNDELEKTKDKLKQYQTFAENIEIKMDTLTCNYRIGPNDCGNTNDETTSPIVNQQDITS
eukprot:CAMPEP_0172520870 /NCGR_PEP_ID=MMETSP1066-20121228/292247_1 /TAXON_ID=671091 /ORGANISM="Coscinodiscus wailesii, Strain CCMP2513" /LENGTH=669 /DNA_ID=CAMNT_0013303687 /DNA_START=135 /DNA_END=2141 /DNA_ORIENTATION=-